MNLITKMISVGVLMLSVIAMIVVLAVFSLSGIGKNIETIAKQDIPLLISVNSVTTMQLEQFVWLERAALATELGDQKLAASAVKRFGELSETIDLKLAALLELIESTKLKSDNSVIAAQASELINKISDIKSDYYLFSEDSSALLVMLGRGRVRASEINLPIIEKELEKIVAKLQFLNAEVASNAESTAAAARDSESAATKFLLGISFIAFLLALISGFVIVRSIGKQLGADPALLVDITTALSAGDLDIDRDHTAVGIYGSLNVMVDKLISIISGIKYGASEVALAAGQVSQGTSNLSQRTQQQASSLEEIASSMEEMTSTVTQNADNASTANLLALAAREQADVGGEVVGEAIVAMNGISDSSKKIAEITGVINELAFQTNLLALNAAVEAARAGEQGRGFAVVASEVRNLAGRSAIAAKEIKVLIDESLRKVEEGGKLVNESGSALSVIVTSVKKVSDIVAEIAAASKEQSVGITQVNKALMQMDDMTQQNASLVEEASAASEAMGSQAHDLNTLVEFFMINDANIAAARPAGRIAQDRNLAEPRAMQSHKHSKSLPSAKQPKDADDDEWQNF